MSGISRRALSLGAVGAAIATTLPISAANRIVLPQGVMRLTRRIERDLGDGAKIVVERCWDLQFAGQGMGAIISGKQSMVSVDAPPALAGLADIERSRSTDAMFPILLSQSGAIVAAGVSILEQDVAEALREAERMIGQSGVAGEARGEMMGSLALLHRNAGRILDRLPPDLFFPISPPLRTVQPVALANGLQGEFEVAYEAERSAGSGWLARAQRSVVTRIGSSERRSLELWSMASI